MKFEHAYTNLHRLPYGGVDLLSEWREEILRRNQNTGRAIAAEQALRQAVQLLRDDCRQQALNLLLGQHRGQLLWTLHPEQRL